MHKIFTLAVIALATINIGIIRSNDINLDQPIIIKACDLDGCIQKKVEWYKHLYRVIRVLPFKIIVSELYQNSRIIKDMFLYGLYDHEGHKFVSHDTYIKYFANKSDTLKPYYKPILQAIAQGEPMIETIKQLQQEQKNGNPVFIWTNRGPEGLDACLEYVNTKLHELGIEQFIPDGRFTVGNEGSHTSPFAKPSPEYYKKALEYAHEVLANKGFNVNSIARVDFIDDKKENLTAFMQWGSTVPHIRTVAIHHNQIDEQFPNIYTAACDKAVANTIHKVC
ncbi:MAG TPA: hypothetical protein VGW78_00080 [Candidatus Babeliales bacterium]|nr:hypothetical protein [Candidatus Babeliales bacterium]